MMSRSTSWCVVASCALLLGGTAIAQADGRARCTPAARGRAKACPHAPRTRPASERDRDRPAASTTSTVLSREELDRRPGNRTSDLLRHVPGLAAIGQGGQADQLLLRGFDAEQGSGVGVEVDGVPINLPSHASSHGYADTHFLIPDTVDEVALYQGAYAPRYGSFSSAGTLALSTIDEAPGGAVVRLTSGTEAAAPLTSAQFRRVRYRLVGMFSPELDEGSALLAVEVGTDDGPFVHPQRFRRGVVVGKFKHPVGKGELRAAVQFAMGRWFDAGPLSAASIEAGRLTPFSSSDPTQGGIAVRSSASLGYEVEDRRGATWHLGAYLVDSDLRLYTNPTLFLTDRDAGDQVEYADARTYYGLEAFYRRPHRVRWLPGTLRLGVQARADHATTATWHDERRLRLDGCGAVAVNPCTDTVPSTRSVAAYAEDTTELGRLRVQSGVRLDQETFTVDDRDADTMLGATTLGGTGTRSRISPRALATWRGDAVDLVIAGGAGSRNTDARASVDRSGYGAYVRTWNGELGARFHPAPQLAGAVAWWWSQTGAHQVWLAAEGRSARAEEARRRGLEATLVFTPTSNLTLDAALAVARGNTRPDTGSDALLPQAPRLIGKGGLALHTARALGSLRVRALGVRDTGDPERPAPGYVLLDLVGRYRWQHLELTLTVDNLLDRAWREAQVASEVRRSRTVDATPDLLVSPGVPRTVMVTLGYAPR